MKRAREAAEQIRRARAQALVPLWGPPRRAARW